MTDPKPHLWDLLESITDETEWYTQRRSQSEAPANRRANIGMLIQYLSSRLTITTTPPIRKTYLDRSGQKLIADGVTMPQDDDQIYVYRSGSLIPWGKGVTRTNNTINFNPALDLETIEVVVYP